MYIQVNNDNVRYTLHYTYTIANERVSYTNRRVRHIINIPINVILVTKRINKSKMWSFSIDLVTFEENSFSKNVNSIVYTF